MATRKKKVNVSTTETTTSEEKQDAAEELDLDVEKAPEGSIPEKAEKQGLYDTVLTKLGIKVDPQAEPIKPSPGGKLNKAQVTFCETMNPLGSGALILIVTFVWTLLDTDYAVLAPTEQAATDIVAPLIRIYARTNPQLAKAVTPNTVDFLLCMKATFLYVQAALTLLSEVNKQKRELEKDGDITTTQKARVNGTNSGNTDFSGASHESPGRVTSSSSTPNNLTPGERDKYERLNVLRDRDIAARARRSGR